MSLCTWATVVSTVPSQSVNAVHTRNFSDNQEPVPMSTFLYFLELLEALNSDGNDTSCNASQFFFCQESTNNSTSSLFDGYNDSANGLDRFFDDLSNDGIVFGGSEDSTSTSTPWTCEPAFLSLNSEYYATHGFDYVFPLETSASYKQDFMKSGHMVDRGFCDWSPEWFEEEENQGKGISLQSVEKIQYSLENEDGINAMEAVKHKRKEICKVPFSSPLCF
ncbi:uncharacterized protein LOC131077943 [Cryptomeria japonica]|uniref:uncharacterized protein LOC131077943 n=1 Tax=Cryptomeria japonica TaxID=3369 RepID=UPI0027D9FDED|nr:uncharacterized protein LOC131077943 [Cryptomeria japonica]XP_057871523.2 uncharacterized protein LOC131077943 [Cryptomeria japonica]XP_057871524.2 uncharacterized protein LOC131077943 [Cryptomeria japonica]XP_057871525.2 uncharacterized protein LOC131077943 [Cryptomeria japonica]XP_057871526.2 uncharacterized protein LOC131077943 [Cryptomeria japonica]